MKKFLSLVLALVMAMSLVTISAGATEFKDLASAEQDYKEAIDVISDLGIVGGVTADTFQPKGTLTRGAATKFVANLMLGPDLAAKLPDGAPFTDVPAGSTFAKYATYLKSKGVVGGYGNGSFGVKNGLTGDAFLKMVLGALGYDAAAEGYSVEGWQVTVALDAINAGLVDGLKNFDSSKVITREEAAQIVLNALEAKTVYYKTNGSISIGNVVISNNSEAEYVVNNATDYDRANAYEGVNVADGYMQLVEKLFPGVEKDEAATDAFARPATAWYDTELEASKQQIVLAVDAAAKTYAVNTSSKNTEQKDLYADLGLTKTTNYVLYKDGAQSATGTITKSGTTVIGQHGANLEAYKDGNTVVLVQVNEYIAQIDKVNAKTSSAKRSVQLKALTGLALPEGITTSTKFETEAFAEKDIVTFTVSKKGETAAIKSMELANAKTGELTQVAGNTIYVDGASIQLYVPYNRTQANSALTFGKEVKAYLNSNGHYMYVEMVSEEETKQDKYAYVLAATKIDGEADWATGKVAADTYKAQLLFVDGTTEIVETKTSASALVNNFVTYGINTKGQYELTDATNNATEGAIAITKGAVKATISDKAGVLVNNATTFIVKTTKTVGEETETVYTLYVGYKAVPTLTGTGKADYVLKDKATAASYVFVDATADGFVIDTDKAADDILYLAFGYSNGAPTGTKYSNADGSWYNATGLIDGEIKTVKVEATSALKLTAGYFNMVTKYSINEQGWYVIEEIKGSENGKNYTYASGKNIGVAYEDGLVLLNTNDEATTKNNAKSLADDATIVYLTSTTSMSIWSVEDLANYNDAKKNDKYYGAYEFGSGNTNEIQILWIIKQAD